MKTLIFFIITVIIIQSKKNKFSQQKDKHIDNDDKYFTISSLIYESSKQFTLLQDSAIQFLSETISQKSFYDLIYTQYQNNENNNQSDLQQIQNYSEDLIQYKKQDISNNNNNRKFNVTIGSVEKENFQKQKPNKIKSINLQKEKNDQLHQRRNLQKIYEENGDGEIPIGYDYKKNIHELSVPCQNGGKTVLVTDKYFYCNNQFVDYEEFMRDIYRANGEDENQEIPQDDKVIRWPTVKENGEVEYNQDPVEFAYQNYDIKAANCTVYNGKSQACICPQDFFGEYCESSNSIKCEMIEPENNQINSGNCAYNQTDYLSQFDGDAPCNPIRGQENIIVQMRIQCKNRYEEIETLTLPYTESYVVHFDKKVEVDGEYVLPNPNQFTYAFNETYTNDDGDNMQLISSSEVIFSPKISVINWHKFSQSYVKDYMKVEDDNNDNTNFIQSYNLTSSQLKGEDPFSIMLDLQDIPEDLQQYGRYTAQLDIIQLKKKSIINEETQEYTYRETFSKVTPKLNMFLDDLNYQKPQKEPKNNTWTYIIIIIVLVIIIVLITGGIFYLYKKKNQKQAVANIQQQQEQEEDEFQEQY